MVNCDAVSRILSYECKSATAFLHFIFTKTCAVVPQMDNTWHGNIFGHHHITKKDLLMPWYDKLSHYRAYYKSSRQSIAPTIDADGHGLYMVDKWYQHFSSIHDISKPRQQGHNTVLNLSMTQHVEKGHSTAQIISVVEKKKKKMRRRTINPDASGT